MASLSKTITLKSVDDQTFILEEAVAVQSQTIKNLIEEESADNIIPLPQISGETLSMVIECCKKHAEFPATTDENEVKMFEKNLKAWDAEFMNLDHHILHDLLLAANYLKIMSLFDLACQTIANMLKEKNAQHIREIFNIENDFTLAEEEARRMENKWDFTDL